MQSNTGSEHDPKNCVHTFTDNKNEAQSALQFYAYGDLDMLEVFNEVIMTKRLLDLSLLSGTKTNAVELGIGEVNNSLLCPQELQDSSSGPPLWLLAVSCDNSASSCHEAARPWHAASGWPS